jgi:adenylate kinase family enzyme
MIIIISGPSHTGKTNLAQKLLEKYNYPYVSIDHIKMGLIRSGNTSLTPLSDEVDLTNYLWPIVREMIKTAIENNQNLIVEGCYIPFDWKKDFDERYINNIKEVWLIFSTNYIENNFDKILKFANVIEQRLDDSDLSIDSLIEDNKRILDGCISFNLNYVLIDDEYNILDSII